PLGQPVVDARVVASDESTALARTVATDGRGQFELASLRPGTYSVQVSAPRFRAFARPGVRLRAAGVAFVDVRLEMGSLREVVTVTAAPGEALTRDGAALVAELEGEALAELPRISRDVQDFLTLLPAVLGTHDDPQVLGGRSYGLSYVQDGQPSAAPAFGTLSYAAPSLGAVEELRVLSIAAGAEYGGVGTVLVTSRRGTAERRGGAFYDFGADELNALTYGQKLAGVRRGQPGSDTHEHRFGATLGGPLRRGRTFFFAAYEGGRHKEVAGGERAVVPSAAMRRGDFSQASFVVRDPLTGQPFPGNVIPAHLLDPAALRLTDLFYPLPNQGLLANGFGIYQQFVPLHRRRDRADLRLDHELGPGDSLFARASAQSRDPEAFTFEGGPALTQLGTLDQTARALTLAAGWTRAGRGRFANELRAGYSLDDRHRRSRYRAGEVADRLGLEIPSIARGLPGFPMFVFSGANRPADIVDQRANSLRDLRQSTLSVSDTVTFWTGRHVLKAGAALSRQGVRDGYSAGATEAKGR
ncbi:MAG TPA: carboxypeptidase-like regulatory domain-containing protein, partial [Vicinamibacteria bacterium]|nr:carboxypeptidase-like regulatory domain-containing protein [Vicinamibacteria bacterium]